MKPWIFMILILSPQTQAAAPLQCDPVDQERMQWQIDRINRRYDDFFRVQREREEREAELQKGVAEVKRQQKARAEELERARQAYRAIPKDYAREEALRRQWEAEQKERVKSMELARLCEVQQKEKAEQLLKKGRAIPDLKEFDLE